MKGILFKPDMNLAIREGRKTVTRRLMNPQPIIDRGIMRWNKGKVISINMADHADLAVPYAPYLPGETVYVKEAWRAMAMFDHLKPSEIDDKTPIWFRDTIGIYSVADGCERGRWRSPMFLPECYARTFLLIKDVRPERLQEIGEGRHDEVAKEGWPFGYDIDETLEAPVNTFRRYWDSINPKHPWAENPFVWRIEFEVKDK